MTNLSDPIFNNEDAAREYLEAQRWPDGPYCPFCGQFETVSRLPEQGAMGKGWLHCKDCRKKFTVRVGSVYERSHIPLHKWVLATHLMCASKKGISAHQLHRMLGITYKSAWFMAHRIREAMKDEAPAPLGGEGKAVEVDETYISRKRPRKAEAFTRGGRVALAALTISRRRLLFLEFDPRLAGALGSPGLRGARRNFGSRAGRVVGYSPR